MSNSQAMINSKAMINPQFKGLAGEYVFDYDALNALAEREAAAYKAAMPFPHIVIDDFVTDEIEQRLQNGFPPADPTLQERDNTAFVDEDTRKLPAQKNKLGIRNELAFDPFVRHVLWEMQSQAFILFLEKLTGIQNLLPDPRLLGGGTHQTLPGGLLRIHADFNKHRIYDIDRRINLLLYLNDDWHDEYGGHLELWDRGLTACQKRVLPIAKRLIIFSTGSDTWHGHPHPLTCPPGRARRSLALYYYTNGRPAAETHPKHKTLWPLLPGEQLPEDGLPSTD
jgi:Rps23 Pro-64 3,4-dihydroxylase Tpa1-like proline 4-hydroxylase